GFSAASASTTRPVRSTRSTHCASTASSRERLSPAGGCCAAIHGAAGELTTHDARAPPAARARLPPRPERAPPDWPAVGLVDRCANRDRADAARSTDGSPDSLDAADAAVRTSDEGNPEEVQGRPPAAER